ncbi:MAG: 4Fe-4S dicluster domain-containing protein [Candidatus Omnitrophica bacterium]|nr:4Fe-4S dicluster domain-containing protein [Candidatus Omnitrophota bacterium]
MGIVTVDREKCVKCGACADVCPLNLINLTEKEGPSEVVWARRACIGCGHCVCVCPEGALSHASMPPEECPGIKEELKPSLEQAKQFVRTRRSIRSYRKEPVKKETLFELIKASRYAPTGHNLQNVKWKVFYSRDRVDMLRDMVISFMKKMVEQEDPLAKALHMDMILKGCEAGSDIILRGAPHVIIAYGKSEDRIACGSCMIAMTHLDLLAQAFGLGTCWGGFIDMALGRDPSNQQLLGLPEGCISYASMMTGYPKHKYRRMPARNEPEVDFA